MKIPAQIKLQKKHHFSPLRYPGGKTSLAFFLDEVLKKINLSDGVYVEPYAGGAGAALTLLMLEKVNEIIINDLDHSIYSFWRSIINSPDEFIDKINSTPITIREWYKQKHIYNDRYSSEINLGFATFFLNRTNRSGIVEGGPIGGVGQKSKWKINVRFNKESLIKRIRRISLYADRITVKNLDGIYLLRKLRRLKNILVYLDPPYYNKGSSLYLNHYKEIDHKNLADFLNSNTALNWVLTYDNVDKIKKLYSNRLIKKFSLNYSAYHKTKSSEIMIFSDTLTN